MIATQLDQTNSLYLENLAKLKTIELWNNKRVYCIATDTCIDFYRIHQLFLENEANIYYLLNSISIKGTKIKVAASNRNDFDYMHQCIKKINQALKDGYLVFSILSHLKPPLNENPNLFLIDFKISKYRAQVPENNFDHWEFYRQLIDTVIFSNYLEHIPKLGRLLVEIENL